MSSPKAVAASLLFLLFCAWTLSSQESPAAKPMLLVDQLGDPLPLGAISRIGTSRLYMPRLDALEFTSDGKYLVSRGWSQPLRIWDAADGKFIRDLGPANLAAWALSRDGKTIVTCEGKSKDLHFWSLVTGRENFPALPLDGQAAALAFSPDGKKLAIALDGKKDIHIVELATRREERILPSSLISRLEFLGGGEVLVGTSIFRDLSCWTISDGKDVRVPEGSMATELVGSPGGTCFGAVQYLRKDPSSSLPHHDARVWDASSGKERIKILDAGGLALSPDDKLAAFARRDTIDIFDLKNATIVKQLPIPDIRGRLSFSPDGKRLAYSCWSQDIQILDVETGKIVLPPNRLPDWVLRVAFTQDDKSLITACRRGLVSSWDPLTGNALAEFHEPPADFRPNPSADWPPNLSSDGKVAALGGAGDASFVWEVATGRTLLQKTEPYTEQSFLSNDGTRLLVSLRTRKVVEFDVKTGEKVHTVEIAEKYYYVGAAAPDATTFVTFASEDGFPIRLYDMASGKLLGTMALANDGTSTSHMAYSSDGKYIVTSHSVVPVEGKYPTVHGELLRLWDVATQREIKRFQFPAFAIGVERAVIAKDGRMIAASYGGSNRTIDVFEILTGQVRARFEGHLNDVRALAFSSSGKLLASGSMDDTALVWDLTGQFREGGWSKRSVTPQELKRLWDDLASDDAARAYKAIWSLALCEQGPSFLSSKIPSWAAPDGAKIKKLLADLDSEQYPVREQASRELAGLGYLAQSAAENALKHRPSLEAAQRLQAFLKVLTSRPVPLELLRELRAIEALEYAATPEAIQALRKLALEIDESRLAQEAQASLGRLAARK